MSVDWHNRVKKLALAYETGWEYIVGSGEAGSVLTDAFLEMAGKNRARFGRIWEKHEREFLQAVPLGDGGAKRLRSAIVIKASAGDGGKCLRAGTGAYTITEDGRLVRFRTCSGLTLTSASLRYAILKEGLSEWLVYDSGWKAETELCGFVNRLLGARQEELAHPVFEWGFDGLCDGRDRLSFAVVFPGGGKPGPEIAQPGSWSVTDGEHVYPLSLEQAKEGFFLGGDTPEFARRLHGERYVVRLEFPAGEVPGQDWQEALCGDILLREAGNSLKPELCLTDGGAEEAGCVRPFGSALYEASCCYFACDRAAAGREGDIALRFTEEFETEEQIPEPPSKEYEKLYRKYPWMRQEETVREWRAEHTVWEYFNGSLWRLLPGSGAWETGCRPEKAGERIFRWTRPSDMQPCCVEGEEHYYIRLRLAGVKDSYAPYYRKYIPVMRDVCFETGEYTAEPVMRRLPESGGWQEAKIFLGFDREVTPQDSWYTGAESLSFSWEQIEGQESRHGMEAFWVGLEGKEAQEWKDLVPNYVEILQEKSEDDGDGDSDGEHLEIHAMADFSVETEDMEVLEAMSVAESRYDKEGPPVCGDMRVDAAKHYFAHYGRLLTLYDMELLLRERYPYLELGECLYQEEAGELHVALHMGQPFSGRTEELLLEASEWLGETLSRTGPLWLKNICVKCTLS